MASFSATPERWRPSVQTGPWLGLESYREEDSSRYFGRETETEELLAMVKRAVLSVLFGPSGIGKTSLLRAGLFKRLLEEGYFPVYVRAAYKEGGPPVSAQVRLCIQQSLADRGADEDFAGGQPGETLWEYLHTVEFWDRNNRLLTPVLFFDQFEELFTLGAGTAEAAEFTRELADLIENYLPAPVSEKWSAPDAKIPEAFRRQNYKVVIALREDFVHRLDGLRKSIPSVMQNRYLLAQLNGSQALDAVLKPGAEIVTETVATQIVRFVAATSAGAAQGPDTRELRDLRVEPALLSVVCQELYARAVAAGEQTITATAVDAARGDVLNDFYGRSFDGLPAAARVFVEDRLLTQSGFRNTAPLEDANRAGLDDRTISALIDRRLIRVEQRLGISHVELTHDLLAKVVENSRKSRQERERAAAAEREREAQARQLRRTRWVLLVLGITTLASLVSGTFAVYAWRQARDAAAQANLQRARAEAAEQRANGISRSLVVEYLTNQKQAAQAKGDVTALNNYNRQLDNINKQIAEVRVGVGAAAQLLRAVPRDAKVALEATMRPEAVLSESRIDPAKFIQVYGTAFRPLTPSIARNVTTVLKLLNDTSAIADIRQAAYLLATINFESGQSFTPDQEKGPEANFARYEPGTRLGAMLGNTAPGDGFRYRGRGYSFITGKGNYAKFGHLLGLGDGLLDNPDRMLEPAIAFRTIAEGLLKGWFTGRKLSDYISGGAVDYVNARRCAGGMDHAFEIAQSAAKLEQVLGSSLESAKTAK